MPQEEIKKILTKVTMKLGGKVEGMNVNQFLGLAIRPGRKG